MTFAQYLKIENSLGGIGCTNREFIRACLDYILPQARHHHLYRKARHAFIRDGLNYLNNSRRIAFGMKIKTNYTEPPTAEDIDNAWYFHNSGCWHDYY